MNVEHDGTNWVFTHGSIRIQDANFDKLLSKVNDSYKNANENTKSQITQAFNEALQKKLI